jgi:hypothetical protein
MYPFALFPNEMGLEQKLRCSESSLTDLQSKESLWMMWVCKSEPHLLQKWPQKCSTQTYEEHSISVARISFLYISNILKENLEFQNLFTPIHWCKGVHNRGQFLFQCLKSLTCWSFATLNWWNRPDCETVALTTGLGGTTGTSRAGRNHWD